MEGDPKSGRKVTTAPRVTVLSGESAALSIQTQTLIAAPPPLISNILPRLGAECRTFEPTIPTGTTLSVTPIASEDKKDILLNLNVQINSPLGMKSYVVERPLPDGTIAKYKQEVPQIETVSVQTRATVPDGGTILLAGLKVKSKGEQDGQIVEKDLLIFIKAEIVEIDPNATGSMGLPMMGYGGYGGVYGPGGYERGYGPYISRYGRGYGGYGMRYGGGYGGMYGTGPLGGTHPYYPYGPYGDGYGAGPYGGGYGRYGRGYGGGYGGRYGGDIEAYRKHAEPNKPDPNSGERR
jgi:hypothetical protein